LQDFLEDLPQKRKLSNLLPAVNAIDKQALLGLVSTCDTFHFWGTIAVNDLRGVQRIASLKNLTPFAKASPVRKKSVNPDNLKKI
jgi:hypothetical protein